LAIELRTSPWPGTIIHAQRSVCFDLAIERLSRAELDFAEGDPDVRMNLSMDMNSGAIGQWLAALRLERIFRRDHKLVLDLLSKLAGKRCLPFASITWSRFNGSAALPRSTLSLRVPPSGTTGWLPCNEINTRPDCRR